MNIRKLKCVSAFVLGLSVVSGAISSERAALYDKVEIVDSYGYSAIKTKVDGCRDTLQQDFRLNVNRLDSWFSGAFGEGGPVYTVEVVDNSGLDCGRGGFAIGVGEVVIPVLKPLADDARLIVINPISKAPAGKIPSDDRGSRHLGNDGSVVVW